MKSKLTLKLDDIDAFIFDFDGVLTDNMVFLSEDYKEFVCCSRADGLAFDILRKIKKPAFILSTEKNKVVSARAKKLKVTAIQNCKNKLKDLKKIINNNGYNKDRILFVGNDVNDYQAMNFCGYKVCPFDSHQEIKNICDIVLKTKGGKGIVRELLEDVFKLDFIKILSN
jgi:YrbI family 3-deoxy-D-manno-octulosonate 8-phosphate phosphatase